MTYKIFYTFNDGSTLEEMLIDIPPIDVWLSPFLPIPGNYGFLSHTKIIKWQYCKDLIRMHGEIVKIQTIEVI